MNWWIRGFVYWCHEQVTLYRSENSWKQNTNSVSKIILTFYCFNKKILTISQNSFWNKIPFLIFHNIYQIWSLPTRTLPCLLLSWGLDNADDTNTNNSNNLVVESVILMGTLSTHWMIMWMEWLTHLIASVFFTRFLQFVDAKLTRRRLIARN